MTGTNAHESDPAENSKFDATEFPRKQITVNREGSGHTVNVNGTEGAFFLGIIVLILLWALLRSEARNRELQAQVVQSKY